MSLIVPDQDARERCVTDFSTNLVVEAAAGTGKTTLMSCRVAMLLAEGRHPGTIAAISFTEASASELGKRIHSVVDELLSGSVPLELKATLPNGLSPEQENALEVAVAYIDELTVTTIHSFCQQIIVDNAVEAKLDPGIKIADEMAADAMFDQAFSDWFIKALSSGKTLDRAVVVLAEDDPLEVERELRDLANVRRQHRRALPPRPDFLARPDIELVDAIDAYARWVADHPFDKKTNDYVAGFDQLRSYYDGAFAREVDFDTLWRLTKPPRVGAMKWKSFEFKAFQRLGPFKKAHGEEQGARLHDKVLALYQAVGEKLLALLAHAGSRMIWQLSGSMQAAIDAYDEMKQRAAVMDFDDLLAHARDLVIGNKQVRDNVATRFPIILVDECQDSDILQIEILFAIAADGPVSDWRQARLRPGALFFVGDPKQSIYRFRNADIVAYRAARDLIISQPNGALVEITANFRSRSSIIDFVNLNFAEVFDGGSQPAYVALHPTIEHQPAAMPHVVRLSIGTEDEGPGEVRRLEALAVGEICDQLIGRLPVRQKDGSVRPARAGDIALMAASHTELWRYEQELERRRIPVASQAGKALMRRPETLDVLTLLRALSDATDKLAFGALLRGPIIGLSDAELLDIIKELGEWKDGRPPDLSLLIDVSVLSNAYAKSAIQTLQRLRRRSFVIPPAQLLSEAIEALLMRPILAARHVSRNARAITNLDALVEMARRYSVFGLSSFVEELQQQWERGAIVQEGRSDSVEEAVQIVTMHNSKGLEWPIVIPIGTATNFRPSSQFVHQPSDNTLHWVVGGVAPASLDAARKEEARQQALERQRMWYVVCTRARDLLIVPNLPTSRAASWYRAVRLDKLELPEVKLDLLPERVLEDRAGEDNLQTAEKFAEEAAIVVASAPELRWRQPSLHDADRTPPDIDLPPSSELTDPAPIGGAGPLRGTLLHKLMEEVIAGELEVSLEALTHRADELLTELRAQLPDSEVEFPNANQAAKSIRDTVAIGDVAAMLPFLVAEVPVWHSDGATLLAGRVDALIVRDGKVLGLLDWKSDTAPSPEIRSRYVTQVSDYLEITSAIAGAVVFMTTGELIWIGARDQLLTQLK
ncbi:exodeoxyribonuclease V subunit beta [Mesorhizobium sp. Mes31]|uniref:UvrD-helicase domain-containing protein n=1 Tax=Mesorhizobium sp. Mes31 TaxID=2926017 RepID=UPI002118BCA4|nr:UvrD-helicase domain-containing protein [Mesorhizobium sp. Mes31]